jgi:15-cis-phytoene synthase
MVSLYNSTSFGISRIVTTAYSTSFSLGIRVFAKEFRDPIYAVYAFVRLADEIVDSFHGHDKKSLLEKFRNETFTAIEEGISTNPVIHAFQQTVNKYNIDHKLITAFLDSMEKDLTRTVYDKGNFDTYIYGSAEVVGLMCLYVFCSGNKDQYEKLYPAAMRLGAAFQKVNFLRDIKDDLEERGRIYIPGVSGEYSFNDDIKRKLEEDVEEDFKQAYTGIMNLPSGVKLGVYSAYLYYYMLFRKIKKLSINDLLRERVRINNLTKTALLIKSFFKIRVMEAA